MKGRQTVTIYHFVKQENGPSDVARAVLDGVHLEYGRQWDRASKQGSAHTGFLLVVPAGVATFAYPETYDQLEDRTGIYTLGKGDKVLLGVHPEITAEEAANMVASTTEELCVIGAVKPCFSCKGRLHHVEASD